jgi:hypothetical protein
MDTRFGAPDGNKSGRPKGSRNKFGRELDEAIAESKRLGHPHPYLHMAMIANDPNVPAERRDIMLRECASYVCPKPRQSVDIHAQFPSDQNAIDYEFVIKELSPELEPAELISILLSLAKSRREDRELQLKIDHVGDPNKIQQIEILGGLPPLAVRPGEPTVIMPGDLRSQSNGQDPNPGPVIEHQPSATPEPKDPDPQT